MKHYHCSSTTQTAQVLVSNHAYACMGRGQMQRGRPCQQVSIKCRCSGVDKVMPEALCWWVTLLVLCNGLLCVNINNLAYSWSVQKHILVFTEWDAFPLYQHSNLIQHQNIQVHRTLPNETIFNIAQPWYETKTSKQWTYGVLGGL